ncbi:MAG: imidazole glycerol phosphate synthase subunit HisH [Pseudomonas sp.]|jgi:glutamine amidotransferase|uniref:imidazole glycerol phosphate synthase subunit HisH n=1 Tax=Pseudomonas sp. TaxID=306 RepID=UPI0023895402|nr:imidazole glycerol phosphate synthase subunit HisH [Pseudomonas sp.]MDE1908601.1 imidazole glycerol phosphate synthase subunit HisH [Pseudomonas sp.]MDE2191699.1 imidazole glycerol phosphate synthase subunit HisH [Pseudomonas sp.]MDE2560254.1 imidazole glycerol phosphate synthase subunit HisH [Pseudomonas sp.]
MITIIDYGLGNIQAFVNVYRRLHIPVCVAKTADELKGATRLILPGVGAFDHAIEKLDASGMRPTLERMVREEHVPVLGICVGMQILASGSDEGKLPGLGWVSGRVKGFAAVPELKGLPLPHMGWNDVQAVVDSPLFRGLEDDARFYFLHSFYFDCEDGTAGIASASYGHDFICAVAEGNVFGVQFHPEKSHHFGTILLKNFAEF